jgi:hypothetical protein
MTSYFEKSSNTIRGDFFLTPEEYYRKRANIIEELKKCSIDIGYKAGVNSIQEVEGTKESKAEGALHKYAINIQSPVDPAIPKKTAVYHELSHALWDSFVSGSIQILRTWADETLTRLLKERKIPHTHSELNSIPTHLTGEVSEVQEVIRNFIRNIYMNCFNSLEDQRIESLTSNVWLATRGMFREATTNCGITMTPESIKTPSDNILASRFGRPELTTPEYIKAVKDVEGTGMTGAIAVMQTIKKLIDKDIEKNLDKTLKSMKKVIKEGSCLPIPIEEVNQYNQKKAKRSSAVKGVGSYESRISRYEQAIKGSDLTTQQKADAKERIKKYRSISKKAKSPVPKTEKEKKLEAQSQKQEKQKQNSQALAKEVSNSTMNENKLNGKERRIGNHSLGETGLGGTSISKALGTSLEESKRQAQKEVNSILEKILVSGSPKEPAYIKMGISREKNTVKPDVNIARLLARTFEKVRHSKRTKLSETGNELDIEALVQAHNKGFGEYMLEEQRHKGLTIYVSIDGSGSMRYNGHMNSARTLVATMFKAVERVPSVKILANVWSSNTAGDVGITTVKSLSECKNVSMSDQGYYYTPTHEAIRFTAKQMGNYSGKKLMIIITDGIPQYHKNNTTYSESVLLRMAQKEYRKAQRLCRNIMCINISQESRSKENLQQIFKRNYVEFNGMEQAKIFVLKNFRRTVLETLRK